MPMLNKIPKIGPVAALVLAIILLSAPPAAAQLPDLYTLSFVIHCTPQAVHHGQIIRVTWTGANNDTFPVPGGFGPAYGPWDDGIFLTDSSTNILIGTAQFTGVLTHGQSYNRTMDFTIPTYLPDGTYRVAVKIDYNPTNSAGRVAEANEGNNQQSGDLGPGSCEIVRLQCLDMHHEGNGTYAITWTTVTNSIYEIWRRPDMNTPWSILVSNIQATPPTNTSTLSEQGSARGFFRIRAAP
jgi:hypothetical protein